MDSKLYFCWELQGSQHLYLRVLRILRNLRIGIGKITYALFLLPKLTHIFFHRPRALDNCLQSISIGQQLNPRVYSIEMAFMTPLIDRTPSICHLHC